MIHRRGRRGRRGRRDENQRGDTAHDEPRGLPIGNLTSQLWGNTALGAADSYIQWRAIGPIVAAMSADIDTNGDGEKDAQSIGIKLSGTPANITGIADM